MLDGRFAFDPEVESLAPGLLIHGLTSMTAGSATFNVVLHRGATCHDAADGWRRIVMPEVTITRGAIYTARISGNGWAPHQQPSPSAYLPLRWSDLYLFAEDGTLRLYTENEARHGSAGLFVSSESEHAFTFAVTRAAELRHVARHLAAATGASTHIVLSMLVMMTKRRAAVTPVAA
jgi:hypothetical protein